MVDPLVLAVEEQAPGWSQLNKVVSHIAQPVNPDLNLTLTPYSRVACNSDAFREKNSAIQQKFCQHNAEYPLKILSENTTPVHTL